jgi:alpha-beta hydrolase superfamily lysophospholipase
VIVTRRRALVGGAASLLATTAAAQPIKWYGSGVKRREVRFTGEGGVSLAGTLVLPLISEIQKVPGVVLIAGSGPTDRDGNNPLIPERVDVLRMIAERLAAAGIASLRYDKRGIGRSGPRPQGMLAEQERFFLWRHFVADAIAAHAELVRQDEIKNYATAFFGHSEGGLVAIAATDAMAARRPYGLVLASTPGRPLGEIVREQIARTAPQFSVEADRIMREIRDTGHVSASASPPLQLIFPAYAGPFLQSVFAFDPAATLARLDVPCLLLHGSADGQVVPLVDVQPLLDVLSRRTASGEALIVPAVSHNLKTVSGPNDPGFAGPLAPAIADKFAEWLARLLGA